MFNNTDEKVLKTPNQKKKEGRKSKLNVKQYTLTMDIALHKKFLDYTKTLGTTRSSVMSRLVRSHLEKVDREKFEMDMAKKLLLEGVNEKIVSKVTGIPLSKLEVM